MSDSTYTAFLRQKDSGISLLIDRMQIMKDLMWCVVCALPVMAYAMFFEIISK